MAHPPVSDLNATTLGRLPTTVSTPTYARDNLTAGIVHFGVGGFHRAHQAMYVDRLLERGEGDGWGICGIGVMPSDQTMRDVMKAQDGLYTLTLEHADGARETRVVGSIVEYLYAPDDPNAVVEKLAAETTRIVSLTVTEGGYNFSHTTGEFLPETPDVAHDLADGARPRTVFGLVTAALRLRIDRGITPFTIMSCDNIQGNGDVARAMFTAYARLKDSEVASLLESKIAFPNSMVDRITPETTDDARAGVRERTSVADAWPVVAEPFCQWVLEDRFSSGRPPYEHVGVQVVDNVEPYELMKLRLLNVSHQGLCYFAYLAGYRLVHDAAQDQLIADFLLAYMDREGTPTLRPVPGIDLDDYKRTLIERFSNPGIRDTVARLCAESSDRIPKWLLPVVREQLARDGDVRLSAAIVASWARYAEGVDEHGDPITVVDRLADTLVPIARSQRENPTAFLENRDVFGDLVDDARFVGPYLQTLQSLHELGSRTTLAGLMQR